MFVPGVFCMEWTLETWYAVQRKKCDLREVLLILFIKHFFQMLLSFEKCSVLRFSWDKTSNQVKDLRESGHAYSMKCTGVENTLPCQPKKIMIFLI